MKRIVLDSKQKAIGAAVVAFALTLWLSQVFFFGGIRRDTAALSRAKDAALQSQGMQESIAVMEGRVQSQSARLAQSPDAGILVQTVNDLAGEAGLRVTSVTPQNILRRGKFLQIPVLVEARATYRQLGAFTSRLESASQIYRIDRISAAPPDAPDEQGHTIRASLVISTFYLIRE